MRRVSCFSFHADACAKAQTGTSRRAVKLSAFLGDIEGDQTLWRVGYTIQTAESKQTELLLNGEEKIFISYSSDFSGLAAHY
jgi:hypothetical protein